MLNETFEPTDACEAVLDVFKDGRETEDPWGRANPRYVIDETGLEKQNVEYQSPDMADPEPHRNYYKTQKTTLGHNHAYPP